MRKRRQKVWRMDRKQMPALWGVVVRVAMVVPWRVMWVLAGLWCGTCGTVAASVFSAVEPSVEPSLASSVESSVEIIPEEVISGDTSGRRYFLEVAPGFSWVPPVPLSIRQEGFEKISLWARYQTASFKLPLYYSVRMGFINGGQGWEAEMNHLKVYLENTPAEVERFSVSHGYNQLLVNRLFRRGALDWRVGAGVVVAHPESVVRGKRHDERGGLFNHGYYLAGPVILGGYSHRVAVSPWFTLHFSGSVTAALAWVKVSGGHATVPVAALQLQVAPGITLHAGKR